MTETSDTQIALLGLKIDANQAETNAKLDGIIALNSERLRNMDQKVSDVEKEQVELDKRMTAQETKAYKFEGGKLVIYAMFGALSGFATFIFSYLTHLIKFK